MQIRARITFDLGRIQSHPNSEGRNLYVPSKGTRTIRERFLDDRVEMEQNEEAPVPISRFSPRSDFIIGSQSSFDGKHRRDSVKRSPKRVRFSILLRSYTTYKCLTSLCVSPMASATIFRLSLSVAAVLRRNIYCFAALSRYNEIAQMKDTNESSVGSI